MRQTISLLFMFFIINNSIIASDLLLGLNNDDFEKKGVVYKKARAVGVNFHSSGWGFDMDFINTENIFKQKFYRIELINIKHPKEIKQQVQTRGGTTNNRAYVYGKENAFYNINFSRGIKRMLADKGRKNGVELSWIWTYGASLGILKPYYLNLCYGSPTFCEPREEKYSEENSDVFLDQNVILGRARPTIGWQESKIIPGIRSSLSINVDYAVFDDYIQAIEAGIFINAYYKRVPLMLVNTNQFIHPNVFVRVALGRRFYR